MLDIRETLVPKRILIVDDDLEQANLYKQELEKGGFEVTIMFRFEEVLDKAIELQPNLILMDLLIPEHHGFVLIQQLKSHPVTVHTPVIFLTKLGKMEFINKGLNLGAADYLLKSTTNPPKLLEVARKHLISATARYHLAM